jgi:hypothetical protein
MSMPTKWHLAWPCFPVLEVETSTTFKKEYTKIIVRSILVGANMSTMLTIVRSKEKIWIAIRCTNYKGIH